MFMVMITLPRGGEPHIGGSEIGQVVSKQTAILELSISLQNVGADCNIFYCLSDQVSIPMLHLSSNRNLNLDTSLNVDDDLLDNLGRGVETILKSAFLLQKPVHPIQLTQSVACGFSSRKYPRSSILHRKGSFGW
jgi:hypothetical protein